MDKLKELIDSMREILDLADLEEEVKERGEATLQEVEVLFDEETKREVEPEKEDEPEEVREVVDLTPVVTQLTEAVKELAEGQREIVESLKVEETEEVVEEPEESREVEDEEDVAPEPDPHEQRFTKLEDMLSDLTKTVKDAVPVRRGKGPEEKKEETPSAEELIEREIEAEEDPEMRLRKRLGHYSNERPIVL
jgi:hypothetical protein